MLVAAAGCFGGDGAADARIDRCTDRLLGGVAAAQRSPAARRYARETYCERFEREGWIHGDGALRIDAHEWVVSAGSGECETADPDGGSRSVPCEQLGIREAPELECALLRHVRRSEVRVYVESLADGVACDDGTPLDELGVP